MRKGKPNKSNESARKEILFISGKKMEEEISVDYSYTDLNSFDWKFGNDFFKDQHAIIKLN